jgi:glycosyltransferase involved in cell wall biosynthesis
MGPAVATEIILNSSLKNDFELHHFDTKINSSIAGMGKLSLSKIVSLKEKYKSFEIQLKRTNPKAVLIPIGQTSKGFFKDVPFIRMAAATGAKVIVQLRGSAFKKWYESLDRVRRKLVESQLHLADGAIVLGDNLRYIFSDFFPEDKIFVVPNGADYSFPDRTSNTLRLTYLGNYLPGKGLIEVLMALKLIARNKDIPHFEFHAFGNWDNEKYKLACLDLEKDLAHCYLNEPVSGDRKWQALANSDIFIFTPRHPEGHPWSLVEASAAALPIISTNRGAISQNVVQNENGFLLEHPEPHLIADCIEKLLKDESLRARMARNSRELYLKNFTEKAAISKLKNAITKVLEN